MTPIQAEDWVYLYAELASVVEKHLLEKTKYQIDVDEFIEVCDDIEEVMGAVLVKVGRDP